MHETKLLKDIESARQSCESNANVSFASCTELIKSLQEWMTTQHNCAIRGVSPYLTEMMMEMTQCQNESETKSMDSFSTMVKGLADDETDVQNAKDSLTATQAQMNWNPASNSNIDSELQEKVLALNNKFIAKEVKKIIRFKFGMEHIVDQQLESAKALLNILTAQKKIISLIPEAYDSETFKKNKVSVSNTARDIISNYQHSNKQRRQSLHQLEHDSTKTLAEALKQTASDSEVATSDESLTQSPGPAKKQDCGCLGNLCDIHNSTAMDSVMYPSFLLDSPDASEGSKYFLNEMAKSCEVVARKLSNSSINTNNDQNGQTSALSSLTPILPDSVLSNTLQDSSGSLS